MGNCRSTKIQWKSSLGTYTTRTEHIQRSARSLSLARVNRLVGGHEAAWLDTAWFPAHAALTAEFDSRGWHGMVTTPRGRINLREVTAAYYGQPAAAVHLPARHERR